VAASSSGVGPLDPDLSEEASLLRGGFSCVAGVDEAGRGAWAGPLVAAAVILPPPDTAPAGLLAGVRDSKQLSAPRREALYDTVVTQARAVGVGWVAADEIDLLGLTAANELAMVRALRAMSLRPDFVLVDAFTLKSLAVPQRGLVKGDQRSLSIAAASIIAKVYRDHWLAALADAYPGYGFAQHRGYGAVGHQRALRELGPTPIHRMSYAPLRALVPSS
jgi:ribonuclease HII